MAVRRSVGSTVVAAPRFHIDVFRDLSPARRREAIQGMLFISPWVVGFIAFTAYPMLASLLLAVLERLDPEFPEQSRVIGVLRNNLAWKARVVPAG